jgi:hypothetical protein
MAKLSDKRALRHGHGAKILVNTMFVKTINQKIRNSPPAPLIKFWQKKCRFLPIATNVHRLNGIVPE